MKTTNYTEFAVGYLYQKQDFKIHWHGLSEISAQMATIIRVMSQSFRYKISIEQLIQPF